MKNINKSIKKLHKHFLRYMHLSVLTFVIVLVFSLLQIIFHDEAGIFSFELPITLYYLGIFISASMMVMGIYYLNLMHTRLHLEFRELDNEKCAGNCKGGNCVCK